LPPIGALLSVASPVKVSSDREIVSYRTLVPLQYPPHVVAIGSLYVASLLSSFEQPTSPQRPGHRSSHEIAAILSNGGPWERDFQAKVEDLDGLCFAIHAFSYPADFFIYIEIAHAIIDLLLQVAQNPSANTSPSTPTSPSPHPSPRNQPFSATQHSHLAPVPYKADQLIRLKIEMRETEHPPRPRQPVGSADASSFHGRGGNALLGRNEGTVRFLFRPPALAGHND
jgi:CTD kinase subunit beta